ncbi:MAG: CPBP family intramembrane metalloprotease [Bacteroidetes bacterium]|nr:CPBP family intramembrane metalloprotease [Bacteroidota bacterium]
MTDQATKKPAIRQPWLRILLFGASFGILIILLTIAVVLALAGTNAQQLKENLQPVLASLTTNYLWLFVSLEFVASLLTVWIFYTWIDRKPFANLGFNIRDFTAEGLTGLFMGTALLGLVSVIMLLSGHLEWTDIVWEPSGLFISLGLMVLIAFSEEIVFRGYILGNLMDTFSNKWIALGISALLFAIFHLNAPGLHTLAFLNLIIAGLLLGVNYIYTKNLWFSILLHLSWNFFQGPVLGFRVSGISLPSLLQAEPKGDLFITGGDFGLEGSIINTALSFISLVILAWAFEKKYNAPIPQTA